MTDVQHHYADLGDVRLHYVTAGSGEPVVLLHGWPQTWYEWRHIARLLSDSYQVIAPDMRGLGDSSRPDSGYDKVTLANDVWRLVREHIGHESWNLAGHDWGSTTAYAMAVTHTDAVRRLVLVEGAFPASTGSRNFGDAGIDMAELSASGLGWHGSFHSLLDLPEALVKGREEIYLRWFYRNLGHESYDIAQEDVDEYVRTFSQPGAMRAGFKYYKAYAQDAPELTRLMEGRTLPMPVLAVMGRNPVRDRPDLAWKKNPFGAWLRTVADDVREVIVERSGHWIPEEQPQVLADHMRDFFGKGT